MAAKQQIQGNILVLFWINLVLFSVTIVCTIGAILLCYDLIIEAVRSKYEGSNTGDWVAGFAAMFLFLCAFLLVISAVITIMFLTLGPIIEWGQVKNSNAMFKGEKATFKNGFAGCKQFGPAFSICGLKYLYLALWCSLPLVGYFIVMVKSYSYSCATFIKQEYPETGANAAIMKSQEAMKGNKLRLFVQDLSFIGLFLLSILTLGILLIWVLPYFYQARYNFYQSLKQPEAENKIGSKVELKVEASKI